MKKSHLIIGLVVVAIIVGIALGIYFSNEKESAAVEEKKDAQSKLNLINAKVKAMQDKIDSEMKALKLSAEMERALNRIVDRLCMIIGFLLTGMTSAICYYFYFSGSDLFTAILTTAGLMTLVFPLLSLLAWKTVSFDFVVTKSRDLIKQWLCRKYGHNPDEIEVLTTSIADNKRAMNELVVSTNRL